MTTKLEGSCLCGEVRYAVEGDILNLWHCHCQRCQKASGTGHASNIIMNNASYSVQSGEDKIRTYKVADAKVFANVFCSDCGGRVPRYSAETEYAVVPAGSLNNDVDIKADARIFLSSARSWSCHGDDVPAFDRYPPRD